MFTHQQLIPIGIQVWWDIFVSSFNINIRKVQTITFWINGDQSTTIQRNVIYSYHQSLATFRKYKQQLFELMGINQQPIQRFKARLT